MCVCVVCMLCVCARARVRACLHVCVSGPCPAARSGPLGPEGLPCPDTCHTRAHTHIRARAHLHTQGATASALISGSEPKSAGGPTFNRSNQVPPPSAPPFMCPPGVDSDTALKASRRRERGGGGGREREGDMQALGAGHRGPPASTQRVGKGANSDLFLCLRGPSLPPSTATADHWASTAGHTIDQQ